MSTLLIKNTKAVDPKSKKITECDIFIQDGKIARMTSDIKAEAEQVIDAKGAYTLPGFIDLHVHLRDPGLTHKEDIETGSKAAARGGFTTILAMPNVVPVADCYDVVKYVHDKAREVAPVHVYQVGAVTKGQFGEELADFVGMKEAGIIAISEDGKSVMNAQLYREAMKIAKDLGLVVLAHCEDKNLVNGGVLNADAKSEELGFKGITNAVEDVIVARDILIARETGARLHLCHCSTEDSVKLVDWAKKEGLPVTAEVCPHHFSMSSDEITGDDANFKMNPPLRTKKDVEALKAGLAADIMDVIATDHAPHSAEEKSRSIPKAPFGIVGLETAAALTYSELVKPGLMSIMQMAEKMSYNPANILGLNKGYIEEGAIADLVIFDTESNYNIDVTKFESKGKNTPFNGRNVYGEVKYTIVDGMEVYQYDK